MGQDAENDETCLITNLPLTDTHFKMQCGHKFNYMPLFLDIKNHKQKFNVMEGSGTKLGHHQKTKNICIPNSLTNDSFGFSTCSHVSCPFYPFELFDTIRFYSCGNACLGKCHLRILLHILLPKFSVL